MSEQPPFNVSGAAPVSTELLRLRAQVDALLNYLKLIEDPERYLMHDEEWEDGLGPVLNRLTGLGIDPVKWELDA